MDETERMLLEGEIREALMEMALAERPDDRAEASENFLSAVSQAHSYGAHVLIYRDTEGVVQVSVVTNT
jgi:hypothetical protein